jgi:hypothetical protein
MLIGRRVEDAIRTVAPEDSIDCSGVDDVPDERHQLYLRMAPAELHLEVEEFRLRLVETH